MLVKLILLILLVGVVTCMQSSSKRRSIKLESASTKTALLQRVVSSTKWKNLFGIGNVKKSGVGLESVQETAPGNPCSPGREALFQKPLHLHNGSLPLVLQKCFHVIENNLVQGLYRVGGTVEGVNAILDAIHVGGDLSALVPSTCPIENATQTVKLYLGFLEESVITDEVFRKLKNIDHQPARKEIVAELVQMKEEHKVTLQGLIHHLRKISTGDNLAKTDMSAYNLAVCFQMNLFGKNELPTPDKPDMNSVIRAGHIIEELLEDPPLSILEEPFK